MAGIKIETTINLTEATTNIPPTLVRNICMVNEPDNELVQYYIYEDMAGDKSTNIVLGNYTEAQWGNIKRRLTARSVSKIGVKAFPGIGAIAFFKYLYQAKSMILCPVNDKRTKFKAPTLQMTSVDNNLVFTITPPQDITYECYRIILLNGGFSYEYITYDTTLTVTKPDVKGTYTIYCIGYENEGEAISFDSNTLTLEVTTGQDSFTPASDIAYYTKAQIDEMLGDVSVLLDKLNGVVI